jgi:hypothetical protein
MKKTILTGTIALAMCLFANVSMAQNVETIAKKAAKDAGCITENGAVNTSVTILGACASDIATTSQWVEVYILPKVSANIAPYVKLAPIARVTLCGTEVLTVECF